MAAESSSPNSLGSPWAAVVPCAGALPSPGEGRLSRVQLATLGEWKGHPAGAFELTSDHLEAMLRAARARRTDILIDWNHASLGDPQAGAAGWLSPSSVAIEPGPDGALALFGDVTWTPKAASGIQGEEWRYISPVIAFESVDRVSGDAIPAELLSAALTNDPFLDGMQPVALSRLRALANEVRPMEETPETPEEVEAPSGDAELAELGKLIMSVLEIEDVDGARAFLMENADMESLLNALAQKAGAPAAEPEEVPEQVAATRALRGELRALSSRFKVLEDENKALKNDALRAQVIADFGPDQGEEMIADRVALARTAPAQYQFVLEQIGIPKGPPMGRQVALGRESKKSAGKSGLTAAQRALYDRMRETTSISDEHILAAVRKAN